MRTRLVLSCCVVLTVLLSAWAQSAGKPEVTSPLGAKFHARPDEKGAIPEAEKKLEADPKNVDLIIALGRAHAEIWAYRAAISAYSRGIELFPDNALLYRHRGHRYISIREFDKAAADLEQGAKLVPRSYDIWYHLGLARYLKGEFEKAATAYEQCRALADTDESVISVSHWLYMSYRRAGKKTEGARVLDRITAEMKPGENRAYFDLLLFYKGLKQESEVYNPEKQPELDQATIGYGIGNWHLYNGDERRAKEVFKRVVSGTFWPAFGFIAAETELVRSR